MSENNNSRQLTILTIAAVVMSVASLITAVAALYTLKYGNERDEARIARLAAVMEENAAKKTTTTAATSTRKTGASTSASATSSRAATSSSASTSRAQASALARTPEPTARAGQAQGTAAQTQPQQTTGQATGAGQVAAQTRQTTVATEEQLLDAIGAATDPGTSQVDRAEWAADGKTARTTLSEIVRMRNTTGQPSLDVTDNCADRRSRHRHHHRRIPRQLGLMDLPQLRFPIPGRQMEAAKIRGVQPGPGLPHEMLLVGAAG
jgi:hypothetical protein